MGARARRTAGPLRQRAPRRPLPRQIKLGPERQLPLIRFRGAVRPLIVAGDKGFVERCVKSAEPYQSTLRARGVSGARARALPVWAATDAVTQ